MGIVIHKGHLKINLFGLHMLNGKPESLEHGIETCPGEAEIVVIFTRQFPDQTNINVPALRIPYYEVLNRFTPEFNGFPEYISPRAAFIRALYHPELVIIADNVGNIQKVIRVHYDDDQYVQE